MEARYTGQKPGSYDGLNKDDTVPFDIEQCAAAVLKLNYGLHRFLSAVIKIREAEEPGESTAAYLRALLNAGHY